MKSDLATGKGPTAGADDENSPPIAELLNQDTWLASHRAAEPASLFVRFWEELASLLSLGHTSHLVLDAFSNVDVTAERIGQFLAANPYYEEQFFRQIRALSKREDQPSATAAVVLLGMQRSRDLIISLQIYKTIHGKTPPWTPEGKLEFAPKDLLKHAQKAEELAAAAKDSYADTSYAAGILFDVLAQVAAAKEMDPKVGEFITSVFRHSVRTAALCRELATVVTDTGLNKYVGPAGLVHDIGKAAMAVLEPKYVEFIEAVAQKETPRQVRMFLEKQRFGVTHDVLGALCCEQLPVLRPIAKAVLYHHRPYFLKQRQPKLQTFANILCLATNMANDFKKPESADDAVYRRWKGPELKDLNMGNEKMLGVIQKAMQRPDVAG